MDDVCRDIYEKLSAVQWLLRRMQMLRHTEYSPFKYNSGTYQYRTQCKVKNWIGKQALMIVEKHTFKKEELEELKKELEKEQLKLNSINIGSFKTSI